MAKILTGVVLSTKMKKTVIVGVERKLQHKVYRKVITRHKKFKAHVPDDIKVVESNTVKMKETKPISKDKHFIIIEVLK